jgi:hypothetical protein
MQTYRGKPSFFQMQLRHETNYSGRGVGGGGLFFDRLGTGKRSRGRRPPTLSHQMSPLPSSPTQFPSAGNRKNEFPCVRLGMTCPYGGGLNSWGFSRPPSWLERLISFLNITLLTHVVSLWLQTYGCNFYSKSVLITQWYQYINCLQRYFYTNYELFLLKSRQSSPSSRPHY